jgi:hypothetical protein
LTGVWEPDRDVRLSDTPSPNHLECLPMEAMWSLIPRQDEADERRNPDDP